MGQLQPASDDSLNVVTRHSRRTDFRTAERVDALRSHFLLGQVFGISDVMRITHFEADTAQRFMRGLEWQGIIASMRDEKENRFFLFLR